MTKTAEAAEPVEVREYTAASGKIIQLEIPAPGDGESVFAMGPHKSGSTPLHGIALHLARRSNRPLVSIDAQLVQQGHPIHKVPAEVFEVWKEPGYVFGGIRVFNPYFETAEFRRDARKILLVRDPRDIATSLYFSLAKSHRAPPVEGPVADSFAKARKSTQEREINEFVLQGGADRALNSMTAFTRLLGSQKLSVFRYEDVIFKKREWITELARQFDATVPEGLMLATFRRKKRFLNLRVVADGHSNSAAC